MHEADRRDAAVGRYDFEPNAARAKSVAAEVRAGLADSLAAALSALDPDAHSRAADLIAAIRAGPVAPGVFGAYTELVEAIFADDADTARAIADELAEPGFGRVDTLRVVTVTDADLGGGQADRYWRLMDEDREAGAALRALTPDEFEAASARVRDALALLEAGAPELAGELGALVNEIVLVETQGDEYFGGASSFQLWGALFLHFGPEATRYQISEALAHEAAHALLFGFAMGGPLVENPDEDRFTSPLRSDKRPMDGVVHASYVIARMHWWAARLVQSDLLEAAELGAVREAAERYVRLFAQGASVIDKHARFTPAGAAAFVSAKAWMASAAAP